MHPSLQALELAPARQEDLSWLVKPVRGYFEGDVGAFDGLTVHQPGTPSRQLWAVMRAVTPGTTVSYAALIAPVVPCHRVLHTDGSLGGYYYGLDGKKWLLRHEDTLGDRCG